MFATSKILTGWKEDVTDLDKGFFVKLADYRSYSVHVFFNIIFKHKLNLGFEKCTLFAQVNVPQPFTLIRLPRVLRNNWVKFNLQVSWFWYKICRNVCGWNINQQTYWLILKILLLWTLTWRGCSKTKLYIYITTT